MASTNVEFSFKQLLTRWPRGEPRTSAELARQGMSPYRASALARSGWLEHVARGVYKLPGDPLDRDACLALLSRQWPDLHVGGKTALDWRGIRHNVGARQVLTLWGTEPRKLPAWFIDLFPGSYRYTALFDAGLPAGTGLQALPNGRPDVHVAVPERALLELLSDVGKDQSLAEARYIVEGLTGLRAKVLNELLAHTTRVKVIRLAHSLATETGQAWAHVTAEHHQRLGGKGWVAVSRSGERIDLRRP
jgi:hypothetical protein